MWLTVRRARRSSGFDVGVGGGVGGERGSFQAVTGKGKQPAFYVPREGVERLLSNDLGKEEER